MVKARVVINGDNLDLLFDSDNLMSVVGNSLFVSVYVIDNVTDTVYVITPKDSSIVKISVLGKDLGLIVKRERVIVIYGDVERVNLANSDGNLLKSYVINQ